jgi:phenylacetate-CoA ligase
MSPDNLTKCYKYCEKVRPVFMYGYSSALHRFAKFLDENGIDGSSLNLKVIICTSEVLYEHQRKLLEKVFGCRAINEYGAAEVGIIAFECPEGGIHITSENVFLEILADGKPVKDGEMGEVVITGLRNYGMPLIRYRLGDLATISYEKCSCGRGLPLLKSINGRDNDLVICENGKVMHSEIFAYINRDLIRRGVVVREFKIIQSASGGLRILVEKQTDQGAVEALGDAVRRHVDNDVVINFEFVNRIPAEKSGKVRYFVSEMRNGGDVVF